MEYKLHRIAQNSNGWTRPSPRRLGAENVGDYVKTHGFGHEDWNFNRSFAVDGMMLGYTVAHPAANLQAETFVVVLATYDPQGWKAVGYYSAAKFKKQTAPYDNKFIREMAADIFALAETGDTSPNYKTKTFADIERIIKKELSYSCWIVPEKNVFAFVHPVPISKRLFDPGTQRMVTSYNLSASAFRTITRASPVKIDPVDDLECQRALRR